MVLSSSVTTTEPGVTKSSALPPPNFEDGNRSRPLFASSSQARRPPSSCPPSPQHQEPDSSPSSPNVTSQSSDFSLFALSSPFSTASSFATTSPVSAYLPALISPTSSVSPSAASRVGFPSVSLADLERLQPPGTIRSSTRAAKKQQPSPPSTPAPPSSIICNDAATAHELHGDVASAGRLARGGSSTTSTTSSPSSSVRQTYGEMRSGFPSTRRRSRESTNGGAGPPKDYIVHQLRRLAPMFWRNPASSDCRLLVQMHIPRTPNLGSGSSGGGASTENPPDSEKNTTLHGPDNTTETSCLSYATHRDYLTTQSSLLRRLFSESSTESLTSLPTQTRFSSTALPRLSAEDKPTVLLTLPDPHSFNLILHYLYWGDGEVVTDALVSGKVDWMGLFNNIEYLDLDNSIKIVCAAWWRKWIKPHSFAAAAVSSPALEGDLREGMHKVSRDLETPIEP